MMKLQVFGISPGRSRFLGRFYRYGLREKTSLQILAFWETIRFRELCPLPGFLLSKVENL